MPRAANRPSHPQTRAVAGAAILTDAVNGVFDNGNGGDIPSSVRAQSNSKPPSPTRSPALRPTAEIGSSDSPMRRSLPRPLAGAGFGVVTDLKGRLSIRNRDGAQRVDIF